MNSKKINLKSYWPYLVIIVIAFVYAIPQLQVRGIYAGADSAFHFNRAFEAMSRIKYLNFNNSEMSLYGFNASGRVVNALYGPGLGYFLGIILLITKSWLKFQLVTNFILTIGSMGLSYWLFNKYSKQSFLSLVFAILLSLTSYWSIGYWYQSSGGMPWGMMFFPMVIDAGVQMITNKNRPVNILRLGVVMALILESHMLSFVFSVGIIIIFFIVGMFVNINRLILLRNSILAAIISFGLTLGYWADYITILHTQSILSPFVNFNPRNLSSNLYQGLSFWLIVLSVVLTIGLSFKLASWQWLLLSTGFVFLLVASGPDIIIANWNSIGFFRTVQFPMRFTLVGLYLLSLLVVTMLSRVINELALKPSYVITIGIGMLLIASMTIKSSFVNYYASNKIFWQDTNYVIEKFSVINSTKKPIPQAVIQSRNGKFEKSIAMINFEAPDYLPGSGDVHYDDKHYQNIRQDIILANDHFHKKIAKNGDLVVSWQQNDRRPIKIPIVVYRQSIVKLNGTTISPKSENGILHVIGQSGKNTVQIGIKVPLIVHIAKASSSIVLIIIIVSAVFNRRKR